MSRVLGQVKVDFRYIAQLKIDFRLSQVKVDSRSVSISPG